MSAKSEPDAPVAIVCGSDSLVGKALVSRLGDERWRIITVDPPGTAPHDAAETRLHGPLEETGTWAALQARLRDDGLTPRAFVHAVSGFASPHRSLGADQKYRDMMFCDVVRSAALGCEHVMPLMTGGDAAIVFLASVLAGWDTRVEVGRYSASQAGLLALMRSLALSGAPAEIRVNAVGLGLVVDDQARQSALPPEILGRIPLGRAARPDDIVDAILFLLSADAGHIAGSTLVVDGGQSLQSWSNAPRLGQYSHALAQKTPHPPRHPLRGYPAPRSGEREKARPSREPPLPAHWERGLGVREFQEEMGMTGLLASTTARYSSPAPPAVSAAPPRAVLRSRAPGLPS